MDTPNHPERSDRLWTIKEASNWLSLTEHAVRSMLKRRQFPPEVILKLGRRIRFRSNTLREWALARSA